MTRTLAIGLFALLVAGVARADDTGLDVPAPKPPRAADTGLDAPPPKPEPPVPDTGLEGDARGARPPRRPVESGLEDRPVTDVESPWLGAPAPPSTPPSVWSDPLLGVGLGEAAVGGLLVAIAAPRWATSDGVTVRCGGIGGCFDAPLVYGETRATAAAGTGLGVGLFVTGGLTLGIVAASPPSATVRARPAVAGVGLVFAGLATGSLVGGLLQGAAYDASGLADPYAQAWPLFLTSSLTGLGGFTMLAIGAGPEDLGWRARVQAIRVGPGGVSATFELP